MDGYKTSRGITKAQAVEPIKNITDIAKIKRYLLGKENKRDYMLFVMGINVGLRATDLLKIKIGDVLEEGKITDSVKMVEKKTNKLREFVINDSAKEAIKLYLSTIKNYKEEDFLFKSRKGKEQITVVHAHSIIKSTLRDLKIKGNYGTHSLRKTFAYHTYITNYEGNPIILPTLQDILNHSSQKVTLRYIGITKEEINDIYSKLNL